MEPLTKVTLTTLLVLDALLNGDQYGFQVSQRTRLRSGTIYPILHRLETLGWAVSDWEATLPHQEGRPRRHYYTLTAEGGQAAARLCKDRLRIAS